jgi:hypothetical protein
MLVEYKVQEFIRHSDGALSLSPIIRPVAAGGSAHASEKALGAKLYLSGDPHSIRAKVWRDGSVGAAMVTMLYERPLLP